MLGILLYLISVPIFFVLLLRYLNKPYKPPFYGIYQQKNKLYRIKFLFMYSVLRIKQVITKFRRSYAVESGKSCDGTIEVHRDDELLERTFFLSDYPQGVDAVYFNGVSKDEAVICGLARRPGLVCDTFLYVKLKDEELLLSPNLPDTYYQQESIEAGAYRAGGLHIANFIPMRTWTLTYDGEMRVRNKPEQTVNVKADLTWSALWAPFNYDFQLSARSMAQDLAREPWSREYFKQLKKIHQTHYEQMGSLKGTVTVDNKEHYIKLPCVRDHTFGKFRDWRTFHRYVLHFIFLDNGDCMEIGSVSQPGVLSHLTIGYLCRKSDQAVVPVDSCDFQLYHHGEYQDFMPKDYGFTFKAGRVQYMVRVRVEDETTFYIDQERVAKIYERWATVDVNGVKGRACLEWMYNNTNTNDKKMKLMCDYPFSIIFCRDIASFVNLVLGRYY